MICRVIRRISLAGLRRSFASMMKSPITSIADIVLITGTREAPLQSGDLRSKIAQLHVVDLLFTGVKAAKGESALRCLQATTEAVAGKLV